MACILSLYEEKTYIVTENKQKFYTNEHYLTSGKRTMLPTSLRSLSNDLFENNKLYTKDKRIPRYLQ